MLAINSTPLLALLAILPCLATASVIPRDGPAHPHASMTEAQYKADLAAHPEKYAGGIILHAAVTNADQITPLAGQFIDIGNEVGTKKGRVGAWFIAAKDAEQVNFSVKHDGNQVSKCYITGPAKDPKRPDPVSIYFNDGPQAGNYLAWCKNKVDPDRDETHNGYKVVCGKEGDKHNAPPSCPY